MLQISVQLAFFHKNLVISWSDVSLLLRKEILHVTELIKWYEMEWNPFC